MCVIGIKSVYLEASSGRNGKDIFLMNMNILDNIKNIVFRVYVYK